MTLNSQPKFYTVALISDVHDADRCGVPKRRGDLARRLLDRVVHRLNGPIRPDAVLILGDLIDAPTAPDAGERLSALKQLIDGIEAPTIVLPGNHDPEPERFYRIFTRPPETLDVVGLRLLPFVDREEAGYNASRSPEDLARLRTSRHGHAGPIVAAQHVPLLPPGEHRCPYGYTNVEEVLAATEQAKVDLSVGGHFHPGTALLARNGSRYLCVKALCEPPFPFTVVQLDGDAVRVTEYALQPELDGF